MDTMDFYMLKWTAYISFEITLLVYEIQGETSEYQQIYLLNHSN